MRRAGILLGTLVVLAVGAFALLQVVAARDAAEVATPAAQGPGAEVPARCPAAGRPVRRDRVELGEAQVADALVRGNIVVLAPEPEELAHLQESVSGPFDAALADAGQMVVLGRREGDGVTALAFGRRLEAAGPGDRALREFAEAWLGNDAGRRCG